SPCRFNTLTNYFTSRKQILSENDPTLSLLSLFYFTDNAFFVFLQMVRPLRKAGLHPWKTGCL
ncbi:MAG: hypothetical protein ACKOCH_01565, partial [Bacteroidota bacterium]